MLNPKKETAFLLNYIEGLTPEELHEELLEAGLEVYSQTDNFLNELEIPIHFYAEQPHSTTRHLTYVRSIEVEQVSEKQKSSTSNPAA